MAAVAKKPAAGLPKPKPTGDPVSIRLFLFNVSQCPVSSRGH